MIAADDPRHGQRAGYIAGCRKTCCGDAHFRYQKRSKLRLLREGSQIIPSAPTLERVAWWADRGVGLNALSDAAGLGYGTLAEHVAGERDMCLRSTERAILAVTWDTLPDRAHCWAELTRRRIFSLMASGYTLAWVADQIGDGLPVGGRWRTQKCVRISLARSVAELAASVPDFGPSLMSANKVQKRGHLPLIAWEDPGTPSEPLGWEPMLEHVDVDPVVVERLLAGRRVPSTRAEKVEAMRRWIAAGNPERALCVAHGWQQGRYLERNRQDGAA